MGTLSLDRPTGALASLALAAGLALTPGCAFLFSTIDDAVRTPSGPITIGQHVRGGTGGGGSYGLTCGGASSSPQRAFPFVATIGGTYTFDSTTSDYDGVIGVMDASGAELACNDDHGSTRASEVQVTLAAGQRVIVVQGGYAGASGDFDLWVTPPPDPFAAFAQGGGAVTPAGPAAVAVAPPPPVIPPRPLAARTTVLGDTTGLAPIMGVSCPGPSPMQEWTFTAPDDATYLFATESSYDAMLAVVDPGGEALGCNDDWMDTTHSRVTLALSRGATVRVIVGGYASQSGSYSLAAVPLSSGGALTLGQPLLFDGGSTSSEPDRCGVGAGSIDRTFTFTPRAEAFYAIGTDATGMLVVSDGVRISACVPIDPQHRAGLELKAGHRYAFVLELGTPDGSAHTLAIDRFAPDAADWQLPLGPIPLAALAPPAP
jgi:hypothetical protein